MTPPFPLLSADDQRTGSLLWLGTSAIYYWQFEDEHTHFLRVSNKAHDPDKSKTQSR